MVICLILVDFSICHVGHLKPCRCKWALIDGIADGIISFFVAAVKSNSSELDTSIYGNRFGNYDLVYAFVFSCLLLWLTFRFNDCKCTMGIYISVAVCSIMYMVNNVATWLHHTWLSIYFWIGDLERSTYIL